MKHMQRQQMVPLAATLFCFSFMNAATFGQAINLDLETFWGGPASTYAAASAQAGHWNSLDGFLAFDPPVELLGLDGAPSGVELSFPLTFGGSDFHETKPFVEGDDRALLSDGIPAVDIPHRIRFDGIANGPHEVFAYASPGMLNSTIIVISGDTQISDNYTGGWPGGFEEGVNYVRIPIEIVNNRVDVDFVGGGVGLGGITGVQIVPIDDPSCDEDLNNDGTVNTEDLLALLIAWDSDPGGPPDFDGSGAVDTPDLLTLLLAWGDC